MSKPTWRSLALLSLAAACWPLPAAPASAADAGGKSKPAALKGDYAIMAKVLEMDAAQTAKLTEAVEAYQKAVKAWDDSDSGKKFKESNEALKKAKADKDKEKVKSLEDQMKPLTKERSDLQEAQKANIMAVLTPEQKAKWAGHNLYATVMRKYKRTEPTADQDKQIRQLCEAAAKGMPDVTDKKGHAEAMKKLNEEIEQKVLTAAQREELKKPPATKAPAKEPETKPQAEKADTKKVSAAKPLIVE